MHAEHDLHLVRPIHAGERLEVTATAIALEARRAGAYVVKRIDTRDTHGDLVARTYQGTLYRGVAVAEDVQILDPETEVLTKAIRVDIEHRDLEALSWFLTYRQLRGRYQFGDANGEGVLKKGEAAILAEEGEEGDEGDETEA